MKGLTKIISIMIGLIGLSGCGPMVDWMHSNIYQGERLEKKCIACDAYLRSITVYDQLTTAGVFDALLLSDDVLHCYAALYAQHHCLSHAAQEALYQQERAALAGTIGFLITALSHQELDADDPYWRLYLYENDICIPPMHIEAVDEVPWVWHCILGDRLTRFKRLYRVLFPADQKQLKERGIILLLRSPDRETRLFWPATSLITKELIC